jgi:hypothetical protein
MTQTSAVRFSVPDPHPAVMPDNSQVAVHDFPPSADGGYLRQRETVRPDGSRTIESFRFEPKRDAFGKAVMENGKPVLIKVRDVTEQRNAAGEVTSYAEISLDAHSGLPTKKTAHKEEGGKTSDTTTTFDASGNPTKMSSTEVDSASGVVVSRTRTYKPDGTSVEEKRTQHPGEDLSKAKVETTPLDKNGDPSGPTKTVGGAKKGKAGGGGPALPKATGATTLKAGGKVATPPPDATDAAAKNAAKGKALKAMLQDQYGGNFAAMQLAQPKKAAELAKILDAEAQAAKQAPPVVIRNTALDAVNDRAFTARSQSITSAQAKIANAETAINGGPAALQAAASRGLLSTTDFAGQAKSWRAQADALAAEADKVGAKLTELETDYRAARHTEGKPPELVNLAAYVATLRAYSAQLRQNAAQMDETLKK